MRLALVASSMVGVAHAQNVAGDDDIPGAAGSVSPVSGRGYMIGASIRTLYDSNIRRLGDGFSAGSDRSRSDFRFTPQVTAAVGYPVGRQQLFVNGELGKDYYARNNFLDRTRYSVGGGLIWRLGRACAGSLTGDARRRQSLLSEDSGRGTNVQEIQSFGFTGDCAPPVGLGFGGGISQRNTDNKSIERRPLDARETTFDAHLNFGAAGLGVFSAGGSYSRFNYPNRDVFVALDDGSVGQVGDHLNSYSGRIGYARSLGARLSVNASVSYIKVQADPKNTLSVLVPPFFVPNPRQGFSGPGFNLALDYHPGVRFGASLQASRNATSSPNVSARIVVRDSLAAAVSYHIGPSIDTSVGVNYDKRNYKGSFASAADPFVRLRDTSLRGFARITYSPRPLYAVDFEVAHQNRDSNPSIYNFSSTSASLTLRAKFGRG